MKKWLWLSIAASAALAVASGSVGFAADTAMGKKLLEAKCMGCHGTEAYTAADRRVKSLEGLKKQVAACSEAAHTGWTEEQRADVVRYLDQEFYKFP